MVYVIQVCRQLSSRSINSWWWTDELSETCRVSWENKFVNLVHLFGYITKKFKFGCLLSEKQIIQNDATCGLFEVLQTLQFFALQINWFFFLITLSHSFAQFRIYITLLGLLGLHWTDNSCPVSSLFRLSCLIIHSVLQGAEQQWTWSWECGNLLRLSWF